jgi:hypothetical protein
LAGRKKDPAILIALDRLLENETADDLCSPLKWKHKSLRRLSEALAHVHKVNRKQQKHLSLPWMRLLEGLGGHLLPASRKVG